MAAPAKDKGPLVVSAPLVEVDTKSGAKRRYFNGDLLGDDVTDASIEHLRSLGFLSNDK